MHLPEIHRNREMPLIRVQAHMKTIISKIISLLEYQETMVKMKQILENMEK